MSLEKIANYYTDPRKQQSDARSLEWAEHRRNVSTQTTLRWKLHRAKTYLGIAFARGGEHPSEDPSGSAM
jgi:hypothetical protein